MKKTTFVALLLLANSCFADNLQQAMQSLETEWSSVYYQLPEQQKSTAFPVLLDKASALVKQYPLQAEPYYWQAVVLATYAAHQDPIPALRSIHEARDLLLQTLKLDAGVLKGAAYVTLGTLYYRVPKWPIAFGDNDKAKAMLEMALTLNPNGIDANYYYGDFLLSTNEPDKAERYLLKAAQTQLMANQSEADRHLKEEAAIALKKIRSGKTTEAKGIFSALNPNA
jgi:tetratricopeptide (TPR) repeat protein